MNENQNNRLEPMNSEANLKAGDQLVKTVNGVEYAFRWCPPGSFMMGSPESEEGRDSGETLHKVTLTKGFWMLETPVTVEMFRSFTKDTGYESWVRPGGWHPYPKHWWKNPEFYQTDSHPVIYTSWDDSVAFCKWLGNKIGMPISLPKEAQWEYACRAGTTTPYNFGSVLNGRNANCNGEEPYGTCEKGPRQGKTTPVRNYAPNAWGLYDMHGNVWERCQDWYGDYPSEPVTDPSGPENGSRRVIRGGCWSYPAEWSRSAARCNFFSYHDEKNAILGFRPIGLIDSEAIRIFEEEKAKEQKRIENQKLEEQKRIEQIRNTAPNGETRLVKVVDDVEYAFRWCPPGTFTMGEYDDETWEYEVTLTHGFWMLETPVTVGMFRSFVKESGYESQGRLPWIWNQKNDSDFSWKKPGFCQSDENPVVCVSWNDATAFCEWLRGNTGLRISLPTEAQWEYACRADTTTWFNFGMKLNGDKANCDGTFPYGTHEMGPNLQKTTPVRSYAPNKWGLYDMHGNVWEWCQDWYGIPDTMDEPLLDPTGPEEGTERVNRGGSWRRSAWSCRSAYRSNDSPDCRRNDLGFRLISLDPEAVGAATS